MRRFAALLLALALVAPAAEAGDPLGLLLRHAEDSPRTLSHIIGSTLKLNHWPLHAEMVLDTDERLMARVLVAIVDKAKETQTFERWVGYVGTAGWIPHRQPVTAEAEVERAKQQLAMLGGDRHAISNAAGGSLRNDENPTKPADVVLSATPVERDGELRVFLLVLYDNVIKGVEYNPKGGTHRPLPRLDHPGSVKPLVQTLPPLKVPDGAWFNVEEEPTPESWRGKPLLVVTTDPG